MATQRLHDVKPAAEILRGGGLVAFPTETVFGLGVDATNAEAVDRLFQAKGRPSDNPLIVHLAEADAWPLAAKAMPASAAKLLDVFAPGPLTVVVPRRQEISSRVSAGLETVGIRIPSHPYSRELLREAGLPIAAPSANRSGRPSCTTWRSVLEDLDGRIDAVVCEDADGVGIESTVVDCVGDTTTLLRPGAITLEQLRELIPDLQTAHMTSGNKQEVRSPGLAHPHYQPRARVELVTVPGEAVSFPEAQHSAYCGLSLPAGNDDGMVVLTRCYTSVEDYAADFYEFLREADRRAASVVYVELVQDTGLGSALRDRQMRAAGKK